MGQFTRFENYIGPDGSLWAPRKPKGRAKVSNFTDYKNAAAGDLAG